MRPTRTLLAGAAALAVVGMLVPAPAEAALTPGPRRFPAMAAEPGAAGSLVLFGGQDPNGGMSHITWTWNGLKWRAHFSPRSPSPRLAHAMASDKASGTVVLFGGAGTDLTDAAFGDTWIWDPGTSTWSDATPVAGLSPPPCSSPSMAYDGVSRRVILVGCDPADATWLWDGTTRTWARESTGTPASAPMAYDTARRQVVLYQGPSQSTGGSVTPAQTWTWDGSARAWTQQSPATSPALGSGAAMAYDAKRQRLVLFGGQTCCTNPRYSNETWAWDGSDWRRNTPLASPAARVIHAMAYHAGTARVVMYGGERQTSPYILGDTWTYDGQHWLNGLVVSPASAAEGDSGPTTLDFTVSIEGSSASPVSVNYATADGSARAGSDYSPTSGSLVFAPGERTKTVSVPLIADTSYENDESLSLAISGASGAPIVTASATGTIQNDDPLPSVSIADVSATEGDSGTKVFAFVVSLSAPSGLATTVAFATADGTATSPKDYAATAGTLTIPAGATTAKVKVTVNANTAAEPDETFTVNLANPTNATMADAQATGTIVNDD